MIFYQHTRYILSCDQLFYHIVVLCVIGDCVTP
jgi:hypothetical protein